MIYRVIGASGTPLVEDATLLGAVFHALTCSVREQEEAYAIAAWRRTLAVAFRGRLYAGSREIAAEELVRAEVSRRGTCRAHAATTGRAPTCSTAATSCVVSTGLTSHRPLKMALSAGEAVPPLTTSMREASAGRCATTWR